MSRKKNHVKLKKKNRNTTYSPKNQKKKGFKKKKRVGIVLRN